VNGALKELPQPQPRPVQLLEGLAEEGPRINTGRKNGGNGRSTAGDAAVAAAMAAAYAAINGQPAVVSSAADVFGSSSCAMKGQLKNLTLMEDQEGNATGSKPCSISGIKDVPRGTSNSSNDSGRWGSPVKFVGPIPAWLAAQQPSNTPDKITSSTQQHTRCPSPNNLSGWDDVGKARALCVVVLSSCKCCMFVLSRMRRQVDCLR